jgi:hypothetical protein
MPILKFPSTAAPTHVKDNLPHPGVNVQNMIWIEDVVRFVSDVPSLDKWSLSVAYDPRPRGHPSLVIT